MNAYQDGVSDFEEIAAPTQNHPRTINFEVSVLRTFFYFLSTNAACQGLFACQESFIEANVLGTADDKRDTLVNGFCRDI